MITPDKPPPPPARNQAELSDKGANTQASSKPKKAWAKPTIRRIEDGVVVIESGPKAGPERESGTYRPAS